MAVSIRRLTLEANKALTCMSTIHQNKRLTACFIRTSCTRKAHYRPRHHSVLQLHHYCILQLRHHRILQTHHHGISRCGRHTCSCRSYSCSRSNTMSSAKTIDIRSDTVTRPTPDMYNAMMNADIGDDVYDGDPTVSKLQDAVAKMMKKEAALFVPSGTMGNLISIMAHCQGRGEEIIVGEQSHIVIWEQAGMAQIANVNARTVKTSPDGKLCLKDIEAKIRNRQDVHWPTTRLVCLENTFSGRVLPLDYMKQVRELANKYNLKVHLDGARVMNAVVALGTTPDVVAQYFDSVSLCFSKGLGCPVGSVIVGDKDFIDRCARHRKVLGGGMRQAGILAAAALVALDKSIPRLHIDHENAQKLAHGILNMKSPVFAADPQASETNMVIINITDGTPPMTACKLLGSTLEGEDAAHGSPIQVKIFPFSDTSLRAVTHQDVSNDEIDLVLKKFEFVSNLLSGSKREDVIAGLSKMTL